MAGRTTRWARRTKSRALAGLVIGGWLAGCLGGDAGPRAIAIEARVRTFDLTYTVQVTDLVAGQQELQLWIPVPQTDAFQTVTRFDMKSPHPVVVRREPVHGNRMLHIAVDGAPFEPFEVTYTCRVTRREATEGADPRLTEAVRELYLAPNRLVPVTGLARKLAGEILGNGLDGREAVSAVYDYVDDRMSYDKSVDGWGRGDFAYACEFGKGNCTDFHAMFIGIARAAGMPARFQIGLPLPPERGAGETGAYHCWAWCHTPDDGWLPVDISEADRHPELKDYFFGTLSENRVALSTGRDLILSPAQRGMPLNYFVDPYAELDGRPFDGVSKRATYRDVR